MVRGLELDGAGAKGGDGGDVVGVAAHVVGDAVVASVEGNVAVPVGAGRVGGELGQA